MTRATIDALLDGTLRTVPGIGEDLFSGSSSFHAALLHLFFEEWVKVGGKVMDGSFQRVRDAVVAKASASAATISRKDVYERSGRVSTAFAAGGDGDAAAAGDDDAAAGEAAGGGGFSEI